ncbi:nucleotide exchange factor GrpE [Fundicoccus culcitae]|uniref:Protein GrpE n=1 Tax=Fundicoccus culcitae TaxID=2969821 RepID=A0ABY5P7N5_9LACT|nr:nucleotide exchange factor GrpE [Fundicoccus culcitae]UUX34395.1 nucleotide exchange factor GrpE [Fundicoccus culcitae]
MAEENNQNINKEEEILDSQMTEVTPDIEDANLEDVEEAPVVEEDETTKLEKEIEALEEKNLRLQAEIANMQRRNNLDRQDAAKYRSQKLASQLLDVVDNLERALSTESQSEDALAIKKGVEMVYNQLLNAFNSEEIKILDPLNEPFNPTYHQAVSTMPAEEGQESDIVVKVLQKGYSIHDRVLRPAMVIVSA